MFGRRGSVGEEEEVRCPFGDRFADLLLTRAQLRVRAEGAWLLDSGQHRRQNLVRSAVRVPPAVRCARGHHHQLETGNHEHPLSPVARGEVEPLRAGLTEHLQRRLPGPADLKEAVV